MKNGNFSVIITTAANLILTYILCLHKTLVGSGTIFAGNELPEYDAGWRTKVEPLLALASFYSVLRVDNAVILHNYHQFLRYILQLQKINTENFSITLSPDTKRAFTKDRSQWLCQWKVLTCIFFLPRCSIVHLPGRGGHRTVGKSLEGLRVDMGYFGTNAKINFTIDTEKDI